MTKAATKLAQDINTIQYASTDALEAERRRQLGRGRTQSLRLLQAIEAELKARSRNGGRRTNIQDMLGY